MCVLIALVAAALALAIGAASQPSPLVPARKGGFSGWLRGPLDFGLSLRPSGFVVLLLAMCACYLCLLAWADRVPVRAAVTSIVAVHVIFLLAPLLLSTDAFNYLDYARLGVVHHLNPYQHTPVAASHDVAFPYIGWRTATTVYGPLFTLASYPLGALSLSEGLWTVKLATAAASLGCVWLVWAGARRLGRPPLSAAMFVGLNPVLLVYAVGGAHNDVLMMLLALCSIYLLLTEREVGGALAIVGAGAIKLSAGLLLPFLLIGARRPLRMLLGALAGAAGLAAVAFAVFGSHALSFVHVLSVQQQHGSLHSVPKTVSQTFGLGSNPVGVRLFAAGAFGVALAVLLARAYRGADWVTTAGWATLALLLATTWLLPWYVVWLVPLAALSESWPLRLATVALGAFVIALRIPLWLQ
jgi:Glycosyltransferase family 87